MSTLLIEMALGIAKGVSVVIAAVAFGFATASAATSLGGAADEQSPPARSDDRVSPNLRVVSTTYVGASTPSGSRRNRARIVVRLRITSAPSPTNLRSAQLRLARISLRADFGGDAESGTLPPVVPAETAVTGDLRFESEGRETESLRREQAATLQLMSQRYVVRFDAPPK